MTAYLSGEPAIVSRVNAPIDVYLPLPVLAESLFAVKNSSRVAENVRKLLSFRNTCILLSPDEDTAEVYADIRLELQKRARPIPINDLWIGALCRQQALPLASRDSHFDRVAGFQRLAW